MSEEFPGSLFWERTLLDLMQQQTRNLCSEVDRYDRGFILTANLEEFAESIAERYMLEPVHLHRDQTFIAEHGQTNIAEERRECLIIYEPSISRDSAATYYRFAVPFDGDGRLFARKPSQFEIDLPWGEVVGSELRILCKTTSQDPKFIRSLVDDNLNRIERWLRWANAEAIPFNAQLQGVVLERLHGRRTKLTKDDALADALGFPIKPRTGAPDTYRVPVQPKKLPVLTADVLGKPVVPDPHLDMAAYESILQTLESMGRVLELSPKAFSKMGEEALRFVLLVPLNIHYEGQATGETFNCDGKTDIIIKVGGRNIFIAECLVWDGPDYFKSKIDQLLGYTSWRDTKTAIIVFNRNKNLSAVLAQIPELVTQHPNCKRQANTFKRETAFRFLLHHRDDKNREFTLTVLVLDVPS